MESLVLLWQVRDASGFVYAVLCYLVPLLLYCAWSGLVFLDLAWRGAPGRTVWGWSVAVFALPLVGPAAYLLVGPGRASRAAPVAVVGLGALLAALGYGLVFTVFR